MEIIHAGCAVPDLTTGLTVGHIAAGADVAFEEEAAVAHRTDRSIGLAGIGHAVRVSAKEDTGIVLKVVSSQASLADIGVRAYMAIGDVAVDT